MEEGKTHFLRVIRNNFLGGTSAGCKEQQDAFIRICASSGMIQPSDYLGFFNEQTATDEDGPIWRFIQAAEKLKDNRLMFARAKNVWRDCQKLVNAGPTDPTSKQVVAITDDDPIDEQAANDIDAAWNDRYSFMISMYLSPDDRLLGKVFREFKRRMPTVIRIDKVLSLFMCNKPEEPSTRELLPGIQLRMKDQAGVHIRNVPDYYEGQRILAYAYAKCGNYKVPSKLGVEQVLFAPLDTNLDYADMCLRASFLTSMPPKERLDWLRDRDHKTRGIMCNYIRQGYPQGEALTIALKECAIEWKLGTDKVAQQTEQEFYEAYEKPVPRIRLRTKFKDLRMQGKGKGKGKSKKGGKKGGGKRGGFKGDGKHATHYKGQEICTRANDGRCDARSSKDCRYRRAHICDVVMPSGKVCASRDHLRSGHKPHHDQ